MVLSTAVIMSAKRAKKQLNILPIKAMLGKVQFNHCSRAHVHLLAFH